jgi:R.HinP1I restriction endonuclease
MSHSIDKGSQIAKDGFKNEDEVVEKFNNWQTDSESQQWLETMGYDLKEIEFVEAFKLAGYKTDVQVQVRIKLKNLIDVENLQVKLVSNPKGFNQIDKRWIDKYVEMWSIPLEIVEILKRYTGENKPTIPSPKDKRRMFANEFTEEEQRAVLNWLENNKTLIISDILKGRGKFAAEWILVILKANKDSLWTLKPMNIAVNYFSQGDVIITKRGNFTIGKITMQRKGGDGGRITANMLQFKINPAELFQI